MGRRWPLVIGAALAAVVFGLFAQVDDSLEPADADGEPTDTEGEDPEDGDAEDADAEPDDAASDEQAWPEGGAWQPIANSPGGPRRGHTAVWSGQCPPAAEPRTCGELFIWGGRKVVGPRSDGAVYHPASDSWRRIPVAPREPLEWGEVPGVWTGVDPGSAPRADATREGELLLWGPTNADFAGGPEQATSPRGVAYDPVAESWRTLPQAPISPRFGHSMTWTGEEVLVWGGRVPGGEERGEPLADGAAYDPDTDTWRRLPAAPFGGLRTHVAAWLPSVDRLVVWGERAAAGDDAAPAWDGAAYDPATDAWEPLPALPATLPGQDATFAPAATRVVDPDGLLVVAPLADPESGEPILALYDPHERVWDRRPAGPVAARADAHVDGHERVAIWGGRRRGEAPAGVLHYPANDAWRVVPAGREPTSGESATWVGDGLLLWGGTREGVLWDPYTRPDQQPVRASPQPPGQSRLAVLPVDHETGWELNVEAGAESPELEVHGVRPGVQVWLEARSHGGGRARQLHPLGSECSESECRHRFADVPEQLPGRVDVRLRNTTGEPVAVAVSLSP